MTWFMTSCRWVPWFWNAKSTFWFWNAKHKSCVAHNSFFPLQNSSQWVDCQETESKQGFKHKLTYNWLAYNFNELRCQQKIQAFTAFLHSLVYWRKRRPWTKKGTHIQKRVPRRTPISRRGPIWEQCKCWKPFLGVYLQLSSLLSRLWSEWGTGQDGGARPKFLQGKVCHCFANFLWFLFKCFAPGS